MAQYRLYRPSPAPWAGFDDLRREMDALFGRFASGGYPESRRGVFPAVNLYESEDAYVLTAELPGVDPNQIEVSLEGATLNLRGERKIDYSGERKSGESPAAHRLERQSGAFRRAFELPAEVDAEKVEAVHRNGVLILKLPKQPKHQPRRIEIQATS